MAVQYTYAIALEEETTSFVKNIQVGGRTLTFDFQWAIVSEEQYVLIERYLRGKASGDPLITFDGYDREYNWYEYYIRLQGQDLDIWLDADPLLAVSVAGKSREEQKRVLNLYIQEAVALKPAMTLYKDVIKWQFTMTCPDLDTAVGYVIPGGWYHNQDNKVSFCFLSDLAEIGKEDIQKVTILFEVYDE